MSSSSHPPPEPTLSTLVPIATTNLDNDDSLSPPYTPQSSTFQLPNQSIVDGQPIVNPNPTLFSFLSKLALTGGSGEDSRPGSDYGDEEEGDKGDDGGFLGGGRGTESPQRIEVDMAPDARWEEHQQKEKRRGESHVFCFRISTGMDEGRRGKEARRAQPLVSFPLTGA